MSIKIKKSYFLYKCGNVICNSYYEYIPDSYGDYVLKGISGFLYILWVYLLTYVIQISSITILILNLNDFFMLGLSDTREYVYIFSITGIIYTGFGILITIIETDSCIMFPNARKTIRETFFKKDKKLFSTIFDKKVILKDE